MRTAHDATPLWVRSARVRGQAEIKGGRAGKTTDIELHNYMVCTHKQDGY